MTPHSVNLVDENGHQINVFPASGQQIRLSVTTTPAEPIAGVPTSRTVFGQPVGLPEHNHGPATPILDENGEFTGYYEEGDKVYYIVSQLVKNALPDRPDLLVPAEVVRDQEGKILGCKSLGR